MVNDGRRVRVMIDASETDSDLLYATCFRAGDPFVYVENNGRSSLLLSKLECGRGRQQARVDEIVSLTEFDDELSAKGIDDPFLEDYLVCYLRRLGIESVEVPPLFAVRCADRLRNSGFDVKVGEIPFLPQRVVKRSDEIEHLEAAQTATEEVMLDTIEQLRAADIDDDGMLTCSGEPLTVESLKLRVRRQLLDRGYTVLDPIIAPGDQGCEPHDTGSGPIPAGQSIVIDIFPRHIASGYWGDMSRTVCKGPASPELEAQYDAVRRAQDVAFAHIAPGVTGAQIHERVQQCFEKDGFATEQRNGSWVGFFHGTGHGLGLDIHEEPRLGRNGGELREGMVVTVEPGLYYPRVGAVRIEDVVVVTADGCRNLNRAPRVLCV